MPQIKAHSISSALSEIDASLDLDGQGRKLFHANCLTFIADVPPLARMDNIEFFNRTTAALFKVLLAKFPSPILRFDTENFRTESGLPANPSAEDSDDIGDVIKWLQAEGYIRVRDEAGFGQMFTGVVLTAKGLEALNRIPDSLTPKMTVGERLKELSREASREVVTSLVTVALTGSTS